MRKIILALAFLYPAIALAQGTTAPDPAAPPPMVGDKPLVARRQEGRGQEIRGGGAGKTAVGGAEASGLPGHRRRAPKNG